MYMPQNQQQGAYVINDTMRNENLVLGVSIVFGCEKYFNFILRGKK
jgi:hypothetical protein